MDTYHYYENVTSKEDAERIKKDRIESNTCIICGEYDDVKGILFQTKQSYYEDRCKSTRICGSCISELRKIISRNRILREKDV